MKTLLQKLLLLSSLAILATNAQAIDSSYIGAEDGRWSKAANWSPNRVPDNRSGHTFDVSIDNNTATLDIDVTINGLALRGDSLMGLIARDHSLACGTMSLDPPTAFNVVAKTADALIDVGQLDNFAGTILTGGSYVMASFQGHAATFRFGGADIRTLEAFVWLVGPQSQVLDENNQNALAQLGHITLDGETDLQNHDLITTGSLVNEGFMFSDKSGWTIDGDFTSIGDRRNPGTLGYLFGLGRQGQDAPYVVTGSLTNYDAASHTLNSGRFFFNAVGNASNTLQVMGGESLDIVVNDGAVILYGPNTGILDRDGNDALRHLAVVNRDLEIGNRDFTTAGDLLVNDSLVIFGHSNFTVSGDLTMNGFLLLSPFNAYALNLVGFPGVPTDPMALNTELNIAKNLIFGPESTFNPEIFGDSAKGVIRVTGEAILNGTLDLLVLDGATVTNSDRFVVLVAASLSGSFANAASGERVEARDLDGAPAGSFLVTYQGRRVIVSDFLPAGSNSLQSRPARTRDRTSSSRD